MNYHWNPLYLSNEKVSPLEDATMEAEWEDSIRELERGRQKGSNCMLGEDDVIADLFL